MCIGETPTVGVPPSEDTENWRRLSLDEHVVVSSFFDDEIRIRNECFVFAKYEGNWKLYPAAYNSQYNYWYSLAISAQQVAGAYIVESNIPGQWTIEVGAEKPTGYYGAGNWEVYSNSATATGTEGESKVVINAAHYLRVTDTIDILGEIYKITRIEQETIFLNKPLTSTFTDQVIYVPNLRPSFSTDVLIGKVSGTSFTSYMIVDSNLSSGGRTVVLDSNTSFVLFDEIDGKYVLKEETAPLTISVTATALNFLSPSFKIEYVDEAGLPSNTLDLNQAEDTSFKEGNVGPFVYTKQVHIDSDPTDNEEQSDLNFPTAGKATVIKVTVVESFDNTKTSEAYYRILPTVSGSKGENGRTVKLDSSDYSIVYSEDGENPKYNGGPLAPITLTATLRNFESEEQLYKWTIDGVEDPTWSSSTASNTITTTWQVPENVFGGFGNIYGGTKQFSIKVANPPEGWNGDTQTPLITEDLILGEDLISIIAVTAGKGGLSVVLSNEAHTVATNNAGLPLVNISDPSVPAPGSGTSIEVFFGGFNLQPREAGTPSNLLLEGEFTVVGVADTEDITLGAQTISGNIVEYSDHIITAASEDTELIRYEITYCIYNVEGSTLEVKTVNKYQTITKSKSGLGAVDLIVTNPVQALPSDKNGSILDASESGTQIRARVGGELIPFFADPSDATASTFYTLNLPAIGTKGTTVGTITLPTDGTTDWINVEEHTFNTAEGNWVTGQTRISYDIDVYVNGEVTPNIDDADQVFTKNRNGAAVYLESSAYHINFNPDGTNPSPEGYTLSWGGPLLPTENQVVSYELDGVNLGTATSIGFGSEASTPVPLNKADYPKPHTIRMLDSEGNELAKDSLTISESLNGVGGITILLSNQSHIAPSEADGSNPDLTEAGGTFKVSAGGEDITENANTTLEGLSQEKNGLIFTVDVAARTYTLSIAEGTIWASNAETFTVTAEFLDGLGNTYTGSAEYSIVKSRDAGLIRLSASSQTFKEDSTGALTPNSIDFTADVQGTTKPVVWSTIPPTIELTGNGNTRSLSKEAFGENDIVTVRASIELSGSRVLFDEISVRRSKDGQDGDSVNVIFIRSSDSTVSTPDPSEGVPEGWSDTPPPPAEDGSEQLWASSGVKVSGGVNFVWQTPYIVEAALAREVYAYRTNVSTREDTGNYNFATNTLTPPTDWSTSPQLTDLEDGDIVYVIAGTATGTPQATLAPITWGPAAEYITVVEGQPGISGASVNLAFTRSDSTPEVVGTEDLPTGTGVTWTDDAPEGTAPLWAVKGTKAAGASVWSWGTPYRVDGNAVAEVYFYSDATEGDDPSFSAPTYNFSTNGVNSLPNGWNTSPPGLTLNNQKIYVIVVLYASTPDDTAASASSTSEATIYAQRVDGTSITVSGTSYDPATGVTTVTFSDNVTTIEISDGDPGTSEGVQVVYANDANGTGKTFEYSNQEYILYNEWTGAPDDIEDIEGTWVKFVGDTGEGVIPVYSTVEEPTSLGELNLTYSNQEFVTFYEYAAGNKPTDVIAEMLNETFVPFVGLDGASTNIIYKRSPTKPNKPDDSTGVPTGEGWYDNPPTGTNILWASTGVRTPPSDLYVWGNVYQAEGTAVAEVAQYRLNSSAGGTTGGSYNFVTSTLTTSSSDWKVEPPSLDEDGDTVYVVVGTATGSPTATAAPIQWGTPVIYSQKTDGQSITGPAGIRGPRIVTGYIYYNTAQATAPQVPTSGLSIDWSTGVVSAPTGWSTSPPTFEAGSTNTYWYFTYTMTESGTYNPNTDLYSGTNIDTSPTGGQNAVKGIGFQNLVTFTSLTESLTEGGTTQIDGSRITTGTIDAQRIDVSQINVTETLNYVAPPTAVSQLENDSEYQTQAYTSPVQINVTQTTNYVAPPTAVSQLENDSEYQTQAYTNPGQINVTQTLNYIAPPTQTSQLTNNSGFQSGLTSLAQFSNATTAFQSGLTNLDQFTNGPGYQTTAFTQPGQINVTQTTNYVAPPTQTSQLTNDSGFATDAIEFSATAISGGKIGLSTVGLVFADSTISVTESNSIVLDTTGGNNRITIYDGTTPRVILGKL